jgi:LAS superfamily LD-carboxypeptidase LdcB
MNSGDRNIPLEALLTGAYEGHLEEVPGLKLRVHRGVLKPLLALQAKAHRAGFALEPVSAFRGFDSQLRIWNEKVEGKRPLLDASEKPLDPKSLSPRELIYAILRWSALPGASRHHWGTDLDVIDRLSVPPRYTVKLTVDEVKPGGIFSELHWWLDRHMAEEGFFRPYQKDLGGVQPERWHLSHGPTAQVFYSSHSESILAAVLQKSPILLKEVLLKELPEIFQRFFLRVSDAEPL